MRVLFLGGDGMLGHPLFAQLRGRFEARVTLRQDYSAYRDLGLFQPDEIYTGIDVRVTDRLLGVLADFRPEYVVNAVGMVKQRPEGQEHIANLEVNALLPHRLALICRSVGAGLVHISTDCVFSGRRGRYSETDEPDPVDVYGYSKLLGEATGPGVLTLRTSIIGQAIAGKTMLARRRIPALLYLGTRKDERGELVAHAWLRIADAVVLGGGGYETFTVLAAFGESPAEH